MGTLPRALVWPLLLGFATSAWGEHLWQDSRNHTWPTSAAACVQGEAETRLGDLRRQSPSTAYRYTSLSVQEWYPGYDAICRFTVEQRFGYGWLPIEVHDHAHIAAGSDDPCPRGPVDETGACMPKNAGPPGCPGNGSNPIHGGTANKYQREVDYSGPDSAAWHFVRHYNHLSTEAGPLGALWRHNYQRSIVVTAVTASQASGVKVYRADGRRYNFSRTGSLWQPDPDITDTLAQRFDTYGTPAGWTYTNSSDEVETYDAEGRLVALRPRGGVTQTLSYDNTTGQLHSVDDGFGHRLTLGYLYSAAYTQYRLDTLTDPEGASTATATTLPTTWSP